MFAFVGPLPAYRPPPSKNQHPLPIRVQPLQTGTFLQKVWFVICIVGFVGFLVGAVACNVVARAFVVEK